MLTHSSLSLSCKVVDGADVCGMQGEGLYFGHLAPPPVTILEWGDKLSVSHCDTHIFAGVLSLFLTFLQGG
jgi:hypothetical protein